MYVSMSVAPVEASNRLRILWSWSSKSVSLVMRAVERNLVLWKSGKLKF